MNKNFSIFLLAVGLALVPLCFSPIPMHAQQNEMQRAHDSGYQAGVNDARANRPMNLSTSDWRGDRLTSYRQGYEEGYRSVRGGGEEGWRSYQNTEDQRAYQDGYRNGVRDREANRAMNVHTSDWKADRLAAYRRGYEEGYRGPHHEHDAYRP
jgi:ribosome modulation factor